MFTKSGKIMRKISAVCTALSVFVLAGALSFSVYAWLSHNRKTENDGMYMQLAADDAVASYTIYKFDLGLKGTGSNGAAGAGTTFLDKTDSDGNVVKNSEGNVVLSDTPISITDIDFNKYDLIFTKRNRYTPIFARIQITRIESIKDNGWITLTISRDTSKDTDTENSYISSIIRFTAKLDHKFDLAINEYDDEKFYDYVDGLLYEETLGYVASPGALDVHIDGGEYIGSGGNTETYDNSSATFVTGITPYTDTNTEGEEVTKYTITRGGDIQLKMRFSKDDWDTINGEQVLNVYLYMTYDVGLIECFKANENMSVISIGDNSFKFENDLKGISIHCTAMGGVE